MAVKGALLCLNVSKPKIHANICAALKLACDNVKDNLFVHMYLDKDNSNFCVMPSLSRLLYCTSKFYASASLLVPSLNVTVLQRYYKADDQSHRISEAVQLLLVEENQFVDIASSHYKLKPGLQVLKYETAPDVLSDADESPTESIPDRFYDYCALGGTFDSIHNGHKVLLGAAIALSGKSLTIGVTDQSMNYRKTLHELITPLELRKAAVREYVETVRSDIDYDIVPLYDPFGPTITDEKLQCLVVSDETDKGGDLVNEKRKEKGYPQMTKICVPLVAANSRSEHQEEKVSSSTLRERKLGQLLHPLEPRPNLDKRPYLIGLTGGIASGKSSVGKRLEGLGAGLVSSDLLAHEVYKRGCDAYDQVVEAFGKEILNSKTGEIERRNLGSIVFADKSALEKLNGIVWPATAKLVEKQVSILYAQGKEVCFIEAALLLEAGWKSQLHEVWSCIIPEKEAVDRLRNRNSLNEEESLKRIRSQASNQYRVDRSNVVLCTLWDYSVTQLQVEKAWRLLQERLNQASNF